jgi:uroporphyrinogen-III decarboxylase
MNQALLEHGTFRILQDLSDVSPDNVPAWEMIEAGRYMPRRIRGSFRGRELG